MYPILEQLTFPEEINIFPCFYDDIQKAVVLNVPLLLVKCSTIGYIIFQ